MDGNYPLGATSAFRMAIFIPAFLSFLCGFTLVHANPLPLDETLGLGEVIYHYYDVLKIPFLVLGLSIPLSAVIVSHHRSLQTTEQIRAQQSQNRFNNYAKHREMFFETQKNKKLFSTKSKADVVDVELYETLFPNAKNKGDFEPSAEIEARAAEIVFNSQAIHRAMAELEEGEKLAECVEHIQGAVSGARNKLIRYFGIKLQAYSDFESTVKIIHALEQLEQVYQDIAESLSFYSDNESAKRIRQAKANIGDTVNKFRKTNNIKNQVSS